MRLEFLKKIASSQFTLPATCIFALAVWIGWSDAETAGFFTDSVAWNIIPESIRSGNTAVFIGLACTIVITSMMFEMNNKFALLRIRSRMPSSGLLALISASTFLHNFQPFHLIAITTLLSLFTLFVTYQTSSSTATSFVTYLFAGTATLIVPKMIFMVPFYWIAQMIMRSLNPRTFTAGILGVLTPFWFLFVYAFCIGDVEIFYNDINDIIRITSPDYSSLTAVEICPASLALALFAAGSINFYRNSYKDKTRTRTIYNAAIALGIGGFAIALLVPSHFGSMLAVPYICTAIVGGQYFAQTNTRTSNIIFIIAVLAIIASATANLWTH